MRQLGLGDYPISLFVAKNKHRLELEIEMAYTKIRTHPYKLPPSITTLQRLKNFTYDETDVQLW